MEEPTSSPRVLRFGAFEVDVRAGELRKQGHKIRVQEQPFQVLAVLLENAGEVVSRDDFRRKLWPADTFVDFDHSLNNCVNKLREALGDSATSPRFIETVARRGYRFVAQLESIAAPSPEVEQPSGPTQRPARHGPSRGVRRRWILTLTGTLVALATMAIWSATHWRDRLRSHGEFRPVHSLAVLPMENLSGDPAQEYLADSMTDQLITDLAGIHGLRVTSRTSIMRFKGARKPLKEITADLNVDAIVEGSLVRSGPRVRITAQLVHGATDAHLWADTYDGNLSDVLALQSKVALAITRQIRIRITPQENARLVNARSIDADAQDAYLRGRYFWNNKRTRAGLEKAIVLFQQAITREPNYALAYSGLADSYVLLGSRSFLPPKEAFSRAKTEAIKALALDNTLAEAHAAPAFAGLYYDWEWADTEREFRRAIELNSNYTNAHHWYSHFLIAMGRFEESLAESRKCIELNPLDPGMKVHLGEHYRYARQYDRAIPQLLNAIEMDPSRYRAHDELGRAYEQKGMHVEAVAEFERGVATSQEGSATLASLGAGYAAAGRRNEALGIVRRLKLESRDEYVPAYGLAEIYAVLGNKEEAFAWLEKAYEERSSALAYLKVEPRLDSLRPDAHFQDLVRRMRLGP
jgi:TolB-like protein/DNA-binding winged helix-turn-helix (wHTH) protein/Flp pilus assembly protein TadD